MEYFFETAVTLVLNLSEIADSAIYIEAHYLVNNDSLIRKGEYLCPIRNRNTITSVENCW